MSTKLLTATATTTCLLVAAGATYLLQRRARHQSEVSENKLDIASIRQQLPKDVPRWRVLDCPAYARDVDAALWKPLHPFFKARGYTFWVSLGDSFMGLSYGVDAVANGFGYAPLSRGMGQESQMENLYRFSYPNPSCQAAQAADGRAVVIHVLAVGDQGRGTIDILKILSRGPYSMVSWNHAIPLLELIDFGDITFGVFPKIGASMREAYGRWAENSVGDILDMIMQCLEALGFLHGLGIAHRDAFKDNFLLEWHPESLRVGLMPVSRPRVYLNDFETAVYFPPDIPPEQRVCVGLPLGPSFPDSEGYSRPVPPEVEAGTSYDPFRLDIWQFGTSLAGFKCNIPLVDDILISLRNPDSHVRPAAYEAMSALISIVAYLPPSALLTSPEVAEDE
ncbi:hypothetical protein BD413DRAFT_570057 [Trametes elegans]|nr:hypothetical protein BD413DRAFT_570057 [Trametes elegans]